MSRFLILNSDSINNFIIQSMLPHLGPAARYNDYSIIIQACVEHTLYPYTDYPVYWTKENLLSYGISVEDAEDIYSHAIYLLNRTLRPLCADKIGKNQFEVSLLPYGKIQIEDMGPISEQRPPNLENELQEKIARDLENGDWISPKMRQAAGLY